MAEDLESYFESKNRLAKKEISKDSPILALNFGNARDKGIVFITKRRFEIDKWKIFEESGHGTLLLAAAGRRLDFAKLCDWFGECVQDFINVYGRENLNAPYLLKKIRAYLDEIYSKESRSLGIEVLFLSSLDHEPNLFRIKHDGDCYPARRFAIAGGYGKTEDTKVSARSAAISALAKLYNGGLPDFRKAKKLGRKLLNSYPSKGQIRCISVKFKE